MFLGDYFSVIQRDCSAFITTALQIIKLHNNTPHNIYILSKTSVRSQISVHMTTGEIEKYKIQTLHIINLSYSPISFMLQPLYTSRCLTADMYKMVKKEESSLSTVNDMSTVHKLSFN